MSLPNCSRRRLLSAVLAALLSWFVALPRRVTAASRQRRPRAVSWQNQRGRVTTYAYDGSGRLLSVSEHLVCRPQPRPGPGVTLGQATRYSYDSGGQSENGDRQGSV